MEYNLTNEELEALRIYKGLNYEAINQMLVSNCETDIALLSDEVEDKVVSISYDKSSITKNIQIIKTMYELMQKIYYKNEKKEGWVLARGTNIAEIERLKNEPYIDKFLSTTKDNQKAEKEFSVAWNSPAVMYICGESNIPYISVDEVLGKQNENQEVIIAPFTKVKEIKDIEEIEIENSSKTLRKYNVSLENQELEELSESERRGLYNYILENADIINIKLQDCIVLEKENIMHYENIRKLEQLLSKYEIDTEKKENYKDYSDSERQADLDDIERITKELIELKNKVSEVFEHRKQNVNFITNWKKNIAVYLMAECREIELRYEAESKVIEEKKEEKLKKYEEEAKIKHDKLENETLESIIDIVRNECKENIEDTERLLENIKTLISKQQNHAKIAGNIGSNYSALNNGFEMKKNVEVLDGLVRTIKLKYEEMCQSDDKMLLEEKLTYMSKTNIQISTLINYLNNPKCVIKDAKITRFDEMMIIEENELKRGIAELIRNTIGEAELKKLKDDLEIISDKSTVSRILGMFTGRNKFDEYMKEQIEIRQKAIRRTLSKKLGLANNYSIHDMLAMIRMFIEENSDDELVFDDISDLEQLENELKRNFVVSDNKVTEIICKKEGKNLPVDSKKINRKEFLEIETYRFLNKYGYDKEDSGETEPEYQDTISNEIARIVDYINSSKILN